MLLGRFYIRHGTTDDAHMCQRMTRQFKDNFGRIHLGSLKEAAQRRSLHIAMLDGNPVGFVSYRACLDGWQTIYELCITREHHGTGIGRALLYSVPAPIRLKTTIDNARANRFYVNAGMKHVGIDPGRKRPLNIYHLRTLSIMCMGGKPEIPDIARQSGMAYGTRHDNKPYDWPFMVDIKWDNYDWRDYLTKLYTWRPVQAMVPDYEHPSQRAQMLKQVEDLYAAGVLRVKVCPKFDGATFDVPAHCIVAVSVPSDYSGFLPQDLGEYRGRKLHLLGGSAPTVYKLIPKLVGAGATVISLDGNSHETGAKTGSHFNGSRWQRGKDPVRYEHTIEVSGRNITRAMQTATEYTQKGLL